MTTHEIHALSGAYAVDALDDVERARFEKHLAVCAECRDEVAGLRETSALLGASQPVTPPPALRDRLLEEIRTVRPLPPQVPLPEVEPSAPAQPRTRTRSLRYRLATAAAVLAVVGGGGAVVVDQLNGTSVSRSPVDRVLSAADAEGVNVDLPGAARLRVVRSVSEGRAVLITRDLSAPPRGKTYELWLQDAAGNMVPAGLIKGGGSQRILLDGDATTALGAGITVEPAGGSPQPTSAPIALFDFHEST